MSEEKQELTGKVTAELEADLRESGLMGAFLEVSSPRFIKYLLQPKLVMRSGWLLDSHQELGRRETRAYVLRNSHDFEDEGVLQQIVIDRTNRKARLITQGKTLRQVIEVDLQSFEVLSNRTAAR